MKVSELVEKLQKENPDATVLIEDTYNCIGMEAQDVKADRGNVIIS